MAPKFSNNPAKKAKIEKHAPPLSNAKPLKSALKSSLKTSDAPSNTAPQPPSTAVEGKLSIPSRPDKGKGKADAPKPRKEQREKNTPLAKSFNIVAGSYEKLLYGLEGTLSYEEGDGSKLKISLKPVFIFPAHGACVKSVAASPCGGKWLASGSTDEIIKVWDLRRRKEIGGLIQHEGSVTHLQFPTRSHLVSASEDGTICIFRARDWVLLRTLKGHKGRINSVAIHPSGKVGLSVGKDNALRMWDLMRGKGSASTKLGKEGEIVKWSTTGDCFVIQSGKSLDIYSTDMALQKTLTHPSRVHHLHFCKREGNTDEDVLLVAGEDKKVVIYSTTGGDETSLPIVGVLVGHQNRVRSVDTISISLPSSSPETANASSTTLACTISSDGFIRIFDLASILSSRQEGIVELHAISEYDTKGSRLTCLALADGELTENISTSDGKRKHDDDQDDNGDTRDTWSGFD